MAMTSTNSQQLSDLSENCKPDCTHRYTIKDRAGALQEALSFPKVCDKLVAPWGGFPPLSWCGDWEAAHKPADNLPKALMQATINKLSGTLGKSEKNALMHKGNFIWKVSVVGDKGESVHSCEKNQYLGYTYVEMSQNQKMPPPTLTYKKLIP